MPCRMGAPEGRGHQHLHIAAHEFPPRVAKQLLSLPVHHLDPSHAIRNHQRVRGGFHHAAELLLRQFDRGDVHVRDDRHARTRTGNRCHVAGEPSLHAGRMACVIHREHPFPSAQHGTDSGCEVSCLLAFKAMDLGADRQVIHPASDRLGVAFVLNAEISPCAVDVHDRPGFINQGDMRRNGLQRGARKPLRLAQCRLHFLAFGDVEIRPDDLQRRATGIAGDPPAQLKPPLVSIREKAVMLRHVRPI